MTYLVILLIAALFIGLYYWAKDRGEMQGALMQAQRRAAEERAARGEAEE